MSFWRKSLLLTPLLFLLLFSFLPLMFSGGAVDVGVAVAVVPSLLEQIAHHYLPAVGYWHARVVYSIHDNILTLTGAE